MTDVKGVKLVAVEYELRTICKDGLLISFLEHERERSCLFNFKFITRSNCVIFKCSLISHLPWKHQFSVRPCFTHTHVYTLLYICVRACAVIAAQQFYAQHWHAIDKYVCRVYTMHKHVVKTSAPTMSGLLEIYLQPHIYRVHKVRELCTGPIHICPLNIIHIHIHIYI